MWFNMEASIEPRCFGSGENKPKTRTHKVDRVILDQFWTLAEGNDAERVRAAEKLFQRLVENKTKDPESASSQLDYCLQRLIRGLASSRKFARVGFAVALTKLLRQMKIKAKKILELIAEELKISAHDHKSEIGGKLLGRVFAYGALIQSEKALKNEQLATVVRELQSLGNKKSYIRPNCTQILVDLIKTVTPEALTEAVWPELQTDLNKGWEECTPDRLILLLACRSRDKSLVNEAWGSSKIIGKKNYDHILHLFMRSVETSQMMPLLVDSVTAEVTRSNNTEQLKEFWTKVGNPLLASTVLRKQMALSLFCRLLEHISDLTLIESMLFPAVAAVICRTGDKKDEQLTDVCAKAEAFLVEKCSSQGEEEELLSIVKGLCQTCLRLKCSLPLKMMSSLVGSLRGETVEEFSQLCMDCVLGKGELLTQHDFVHAAARSGEEEEVETKHRERFIQQLVPLLRVAALNPSVQNSELTVRVLQFLFLHSFFKVVKADKGIPHCQEVSPEFTPFTTSVFQATFKKALIQLLSTKPEKHSQEEQVLKYISILSSLAQFVQRLLSTPKTVEPVKGISEEVQKEWETIMEITTAKPTQKSKSASRRVGETETFSLLILHLAFDLFTEPEATTELLQDIYVCRQKAVKKKAKRNDDGEPEWVEVVTEILLSMLSRASKLARKTTVAVFRSLSSHLTPASVLLITEVLKKSEKGDLFEFQDEDMNGKGDDHDNEEDNSDDEDEKDEEMPTDEDSDEDDDDEEDDGDVDEELRRSVKAALGPAAVASDNEDEDEEEEDLSDSEMFKLDEQLAAAFRSMKRPTKKEKKEKRREVASFKLRALDLLEVIVKGERCGDFVVELLEPLLNLVMMKFKGKQGEGQQSDAQQLCNRATELFHIMCKQRNMADNLHSPDEMLETTGTLLQHAQSVSNPQLAGEMANGCLCIMRLMSHQTNTEPSPVKTRTMRENGKKEAALSAQSLQDSFVKTVQDALEEDLVKRKNSKYNMAFFSAMVLKYPGIFWPLTTTVLDSLKNEDTKVHTKTQACSLLVQLLRLNKRDSLSDEQWKSFYSVASPALKKLILSQKKEELKSRLVLEVLTAMVHISQRTTVEERKVVLSDEVLTHLSNLKGAFNKDTRKMLHRLTQLTQTTENKKKKAKKRKHEDSVSDTVTQNGAES